MLTPNYVVDLTTVGHRDIAVVGGKNASLGEMLQHLNTLGVRVPHGMAVTVEAYRVFMEENALWAHVDAQLSNLDIEDLGALEAAGKKIRQKIEQSLFPDVVTEQITRAHQQLTQEYGQALTLAIRSSATAEDLPEASFAGQQETYLNVHGLDATMAAIRSVYASLFNNRAIAYRVHHGFSHHDVGISVTLQKMVNSHVSGVMFTLDTESGFRDAILINAAYGLGESVVQGSVNPDEFFVYKPNLREERPAVLTRQLGSKAIQLCYHPDGGIQEYAVSKEEQNKFSLTDAQVEELGRYALLIETHYGCPMDIEWAGDQDGVLYILQARPETVQSQQQTIERYQLNERGEMLCQGRSIGKKIATGPVRIVRHVHEIERVQAGDVLVTEMTDPDWEPVMKRAAAIVTNRGGRTCHAAIIARELGVPAVVGCQDATHLLQEGDMVTVSCAEGDTGHIYKNALSFSVNYLDCGNMPALPTKIMMNVAHPERAFTLSQLPNKGVGLARLEFMIGHSIGIHPQALLAYSQQPDEIKEAIDARVMAYGHPVDFYVQKIAEGVATLAAAFSPERVIVRLSDFKTNEYAHLIGGRAFELEEENPMIGFRGASRYVSARFRESFSLECRALHHVREVMGLKNIDVMVPFVRTVDEGLQVKRLLVDYGLEPSENLKLLMMCEIPANVILIDQFLDVFDGVSIGSNDLTQLTLGLDRDSGVVAHLFDERNEAVKHSLSAVIQACRARGKYVGICGQGPSDYPELALWLAEQGIESMSLNPDTVLETWMKLSESLNCS